MLLYLIFMIIFSLIFVMTLHTIYIKIIYEKINTSERLVDISLDISEQISFLMSKHQINSIELCKKLNINNNTLLIWLSGVHDFKLSEITKLENVFNEDIIKTTLIPRKRYK